MREKKGTVSTLEPKEEGLRSGQLSVSECKDRHEGDGKGERDSSSSQVYGWKRESKRQSKVKVKVPKKRKCRKKTKMALLPLKGELGGPLTLPLETTENQRKRMDVVDPHLP